MTCVRVFVNACLRDHNLQPPRGFCEILQHLSPPLISRLRITTLYDIDSHSLQHTPIPEQILQQFDFVWLPFEAIYFHHLQCFSYTVNKWYMLCPEYMTLNLKWWFIILRKTPPKESIKR